MSHITAVKTEIRDLEALKAACAELGLEFRENQRTYEWYGRFMGNYPPPEGIDPKDYGKCHHALRLPGCEYEIGLLKNTAGGGYRMLYDFWDRARR